jgi:tRNA modification GTPase
MNQSSSSSESAITHVVELSPPGRAAVAVVLVEGQDAARIVGSRFIARNGRSVEQIPLGRIFLGRWGGPGGEELILCRRDENQFEIHCHGGSAAVRSVVGDLSNQGCREIAWQKWAGRNSTDCIQVAARIALADVMTDRTAAILVDQLNGALSAAIRDIAADVSAANWLAAGKKTEDLLGRREIGLHLTKYWRVVVCGAPNVGKSSLINALAGYDRAIVSAAPGTTRDVVTVTTAVDGWPVQFADTAGIRTTGDEVEWAGIELATHAAAEADSVILTFDAMTLQVKTVDDAVESMGFEQASPARVILAINKIDLIPAGERARLADRMVAALSKTGRPLLVSALTGEGVAALLSEIGRLLVAASLPAGTAVPFTARQFNDLAAAREAISRHDRSAALDALQAMLRDEASR